MNLCFALVFAMVLVLAAMDWAHTYYQMDAHTGWKVTQLLSAPTDSTDEKVVPVSVDQFRA